MAAITVLALALFAPFYLTVDSSVRGILPVPGSGTELSHYARIWGPMALAAVPPVVYAWLRIRGREIPPKMVASIVGLAAVPLILWTLIVIGWNLLPVDAPIPVDAPTFADMGWRWIIAAPALALAVTGIVAALPPRLAGNPERQGLLFGSLLLAAAAMGIVITEVFFVWDTFGSRMNTVFKVHYQVWTLLAIATGIGVAWLITQRPKRFSPAQGGLVIVGVVGLGLLLAGAAYGPIGAAERIESSPSMSIGLDGLATYRERFPDDAAAIDWLLDNAERDDHVLEAFGNDYSDHGRVSAITGIPTAIGWQGHELQWRGGDELYASRPDDVERIYRGYDDAEGRALDSAEIKLKIEFYNINYVFVGSLENQKYGDETADRMLAVLPDRLSVAFKSGDTVVLKYVRIT